MKKGQFFSINGIGTNGNLYPKQKNLNLNPVPYSKINSRRIINSNKKMKLSNFEGVIRHDTKSTIHKKKLNKLDFIKIINFCSKLLLYVSSVKRMKREATDWEKTFAITYQRKTCIQNI